MDSAASVRLKNPLGIEMARLLLQLFYAAVEVSFYISSGSKIIKQAVKGE